MNEKENPHPPHPAFQVPVADRLLTIKEVAELTKLSVGGLYRLVSQGRIPVVRLSKRCIRFRQSSLHEWWDRMSHAGALKNGKVTYHV